jgi:hypothetical protein
MGSLLALVNSPCIDVPVVGTSRRRLAPQVVHDAFGARVPLVTRTVCAGVVSVQLALRRGERDVVALRRVVRVRKVRLLEVLVWTKLE